MDPGGRRRARVVAVDDEMGERQGTEDDEAGDDPLREDGDQRPPGPRGHVADVADGLAAGGPTSVTG